MTDEVAGVAEQATVAIEEVSASAQQSTAVTQEIHASSQQLAVMAGALEKLVHAFTV